MRARVVCEGRFFVKLCKFLCILYISYSFIFIYCYLLKFMECYYTKDIKASTITQVVLKPNVDLDMVREKILNEFAIRLYRFT